MVVGSGLSLPNYGRRWRGGISGPTLFPVAVDAIVPNDDFAWSAFANEIAFLNPDDLDGSAAVARIDVVQDLSDVQHLISALGSSRLSRCGHHHQICQATWRHS
jgi:hypothetical protein